MHLNARDPFARPLLLTVLVLAACGGSGMDTGSAVTTASSGSNTAGATAASSGGPALWVVPDSATALTSDQRGTFAAGNFYYNAHTTANPGGEIRGQLDKRGTVKLATLDGAQETPPNTSTAFGAGAFVVDEGTGIVSGFLLTSGLVDATAAHIHLGARGTPGAIIVPLTGGPELWVVPDGAPPLTADQIAAWKSGQLFVNAHTAAHPAGEIRGQLDKAGSVRFTTLTGASETPATTSSGFGGAILIVDDTSGKPGGFIISSGLVSPNAAHVHIGAAGVPGPIILPLSGGPELWVVPDGANALTGDQRAAFGSGGLYYNVHTAANPGGEIRGQLTRSGTTRFASLDGGQETPPVPSSSGFGAGVLAVDEGSGAPAGFLLTAKLTGATAAHAHPAARGTPGPVLIPLMGPTTAAASSPPPATSTSTPSGGTSSTPAPTPTPAPMPSTPAPAPTVPPPAMPPPAVPGY